ncbi:Aste57867_374 [Aphanomyces stellatus]|uniref:Aste57867_374 protein n=1 Tax=Aphanomyces stellatus TaxID=120398 RepID=A0A485K2M7_9STRA|nr:hypothetical protein As57867_000373 [Aphanomyces stellatus]VFT77599.1 Aste57867_374 [Aphanomyces stellatus]
MKVLALLSLTLANNSVACADHQIKSLPGYSDSKPINFDQYAGHIPLPSNGQKMFYWFTESKSTRRPILCGFFTELRPFVVESNLKVKRNPYAWNRKANVVFLESPAGVGFSQPLLNTTEYTDDITAARAPSRTAIFTSRAKATLACTFRFWSNDCLRCLDPKLTGFAIGNPYTDQKIDDAAYMDYYYSHALISIERYRALQQTYKPTELWLCQDGYKGCSAECRAVCSAANMETDPDYFDAYNIFGEICLLQSNQTKMLKYHTATTRPKLDRSASTATPFSPCADMYTHAGIFAPPQGILKSGLKSLIYSGDADSVVNFMGTQRWLTKQGLNLTVTNKWQAWFGPEKQLAGYTEVYGNLTFKTVKGSGQKVPATRPLHGLYMFECFLFGNDAYQTFCLPQIQVNRRVRLLVVNNKMQVVWRVLCSI